MKNKSDLRMALNDIIDELHDAGYVLPDSLKRRDKREPGRLEKEQMEDRVFMLFRRYFKKQSVAIRERLEQNYPARKDSSIPPIPIDDLFDGENDDEFMADLIRIVSLSAVGGVNLVKKNISVGIDYTLINDFALEWARNYSYDLISKNKGGIDATTRDMVSNAIQRFVDTPGFTVGDVINQLVNTFGDVKSRLIATSEITRAYAMGNKIAGQGMKKQFPDVRVTKTWVTNNDERTCELCSFLDGQEVEIDEKFKDMNGNEYDIPGDVHPGDRCWMLVRMRI